MRQIALRPNDVAVALQIALTPSQPFSVLAGAIGLSIGEVHNAVKRLAQARLVSPRERRAIRPALLEFLTAGVPYAFPAELGPETRGVPTAYAAPPLSERISSGSAVVWPSADGEVRGQSVTPLYPAAVKTAKHNGALYELLTLADALRIGRARERRLAKELLRSRLEAVAE